MAKKEKEDRAEVRGIGKSAPPLKSDFASQKQIHDLGVKVDQIYGELTKLWERFDDLEQKYLIHQHMADGGHIIKT